MLQYPGFEASLQGVEASLQSSFVAATVYLKTRVEYIWNRTMDNRILSGFNVWTWSRYFSGVRKHGTVHDKQNLQPGIAIHQSNKRKRVWGE